MILRVNILIWCLAHPKYSSFHRPWSPSHSSSFHSCWLDTPECTNWIARKLCFGLGKMSAAVAKHNHKTEKRRGKNSNLPNYLLLFYLSTPYTVCVCVCEDVVDQSKIDYVACLVILKEKLSQTFQHPCLPNIKTFEIDCRGNYFLSIMWFGLNFESRKLIN